MRPLSIRNATSPLGAPVTCMLIFKPWIAGGTGGLTSAWIFSAAANQPSERNASATGGSPLGGSVRAIIDSLHSSIQVTDTSAQLSGRIFEDSAGDDQL